MKSNALNVAGVVTILMLWIVLADHLKLVNVMLLPTFKSTFAELINSLGDRIFWKDVFGTFYRWLGGFMIGGSLGVIAGLLLGKFARVYAFFEVPLEFARSLPVSAIFPLYLLIFGIGDSSKIALAGTISFLFLMINAYYGVRYAEADRELAAKIMGAGAFRRFFTITIYDALPAIFVGMRLGISLALLATIVAEMFIGSDNGIGYRIYESYLTSSSNKLFVMIITAGMSGYILNKLLLVSERRLLFWVVK